MQPFLVGLVCLAALAAADPSKKAADRLEDDDPSAIRRLRERLSIYPPNKTNAIVMYAGRRHMSYSQLSIPVWRAYAERHKLDFFLQEEMLNVGVHEDWTKPRLVMELLPIVQKHWKYVLIVDPNSLPVGFNRSWENLIQEHMRHKRYPSDKIHDRSIFCPWDCEREYTNHHSEGACHGPILSGMILWAKKPKTQLMAAEWYKHRHEQFFSQDTAVQKGFMKMKSKLYDEIYYRDIQKEVGRADSKLIATYTYDAKTKGHGWDIRAQIHDVIKKSSLGNVANKQHKKQEL